MTILQPHFSLSSSCLFSLSPSYFSSTLKKSCFSPYPFPPKPTYLSFTNVNWVLWPFSHPLKLQGLADSVVSLKKSPTVSSFVALSLYSVDKLFKFLGTHMQILCFQISDSVFLYSRVLGLLLRVGDFMEFLVCILCVTFQSQKQKLGL